MKKNISIIFLLVLLLSCSNDNDEKIKIESIKLNSSSIELKEGEQFKLVPKIVPQDSYEGILKWEIANEEVATIDKSGLITAISEGSTLGKVSSEEGIATEFTVKVLYDGIHVEGINIINKNIVIKEHGGFRPEFLIQPDDATDKKVEIISQNEEVAKGIGNYVIGLSKGETIITIRTLDGAFEGQINVTVKEDSRYGDFKDQRDGKVYKTIKIGNQTWMAENLGYLPEVSYKSSSVEARYFVYGYNGNNVEEAKSTSNYKLFGVLYNRVAAEKCAPDGWHLPTDTEWQELEKFLGMSEGVNNYGYRGNIAEKLKATYGWNLPGTNESGFNALGAGILNLANSFVMQGMYADFWTATECGDDPYLLERGYKKDDLFERMIHYVNKGILRTPALNDMGYSVRLIKD